MISHQLLRVALLISSRDFRTRKFRTTLTLLGVAVGIGTMVALTSVAMGIRDQAVGILTETTDFMVTPKGASEFQAEIPESLATQLKLYPEVEEVGPVLSQMVFIEGQPGWAMGVTEETGGVVGVTLEEGRDIENPSEEVLVGRSMADQLGLSLGDNIRISPSMNEPGKVYRVVGILQNTGSVVDMGCYVDLRELQRMMGMEGRLSMIFVRLTDPRLGDRFREQVESRYPWLEVIEPKQIAKNVGRVLDMMNSVLFSIGSISLLVGALGVMNTTMVSVLEKTREIGIMKAVGARRSHVLFIFLVESVMVGAAGGAVGVVLGVGLAKAASELIPRMIGIPAPVKLTPLLLAGPVGLAALLGLAAGAYPAWKGASVRPLEAIRYE